MIRAPEARSLGSNPGAAMRMMKSAHKEVNSNEWANTEAEAHESTQPRLQIHAIIAEW